jgi:polysaccharide biosynthesis transport protein
MSFVRGIQMDYADSPQHDTYVRGEPSAPPSRGDDSAAPILSLMWRRKWTMLAILALASAASASVILMRGPSYTAVALILPNFRGAEPLARIGPAPIVDAGILLESRVQLLKSHPISRSIAGQLGRDEIEPDYWLSGTQVVKSFLPLLETKPLTAVDAVVAEVAANLNVGYQRRTYLIELSLAAPTPERAAALANAVASEFVHDERLKRLADRNAVTKQALNDLSLTYGEKHPAVFRARIELEEARAFFEREKEAARLLGEKELEESGLVLPARASAAKMNTKISRFLAGFILSLLLSIAAVLFLERERLRHLMARRRIAFK